MLIAAVLGGAANSVLNVFGPGFSDAASALALLAVFPALASVTVAQTHALWAVNRPGVTSVIAILRLLVTLVLLVVLTPAIGATGPAISLLAGYVVLIAFSGIALRPFLARPVRATWSWRERFALLAGYAAGFGAAHGTEQAFPATAGVLLCMLSGTVAYGAVFLLCGGLNHRDRHRLIEFVERLPARFAILGRRVATGVTSGP